MDLKPLKTLKHMLVHGESFGDTFEYFFDHFGDKPEFMSHGDNIDEPFVVASVEEVAKQVFGEKASITPPTLVSIPEYDFLHGSCFMNKCLTVIVYYTDLDMGILAIQQPSKGTFFVRFTTYKVDPDKAAGFEPRANNGMIN
jgi:hypothetical protein